MRLKGKIAIITGSNVGIGFATAKKFLQEGAKVTICDIKGIKIKYALEELRQYGDVDGYVIDVAKKENVINMVEAVVKKYKRIDILINNAGVTADAQFYKMTDEQFENVIDTNLKGVYYCSKAVILYMIKQNYGKIVSTASVSAYNGNFGQSNYAASKAGIMGMTRVMARELGKHNINVNAVAPGFVVTEMTDKIPEKVKEEKIAAIPLRRPGQPEDIANIFAFLASDEAGYISGTTIIADGGRY